MTERFHFSAGMLVAQEAHSSGRGRNRRDVILCPNCTVKARGGKLRLRGHSTLQSE